MDARMAADRIKQVISCRQFLNANGIKINRHGFCVCPLHGDTDASMKLYGNNYYCFGCHKGGDVISLAREMYGIGFKDAIRRLNDEFSVGLDIDGEISAKDKAMWAFRRALLTDRKNRKQIKEKNLEEDYLNSLSMLMWLDDAVQENEPDPDGEWSPVFCGYLQARAAAQEQFIESDVRRMMLNG